ncbi:sialate O-acetylesterase isoform X4 [Neophocaena asiaeorientalis asiaeorientalis]|uniref:Sialate O-acetylesterase isoform X4 n=1 Tax=Neophocaena asiaeorientalis asiaeorientalis TaxID=1706337 RepID=A0A341B3Z5_NEOAA|nr:sialate O-acetylesterase isoform X4 [Neophocaena asiaeorientalis asiaeorientalis]
MVAPGFVFGLVLPLLLRADASADVGFRFASYIDNYMVLQKEPAGAVIWGYGVSGATVTVTLCQDQETIMKKVTSVKAHSNSWMVVLDPVKPGGPYEVMAQQILGRKNFTLRIHDVLFGDVWLCSGQSNMQMTVSQRLIARRHWSSQSVQKLVWVERSSFIPCFHGSNIRSLLLGAELNFKRGDFLQAQQELEDLAKVDLQWSKPTLENLGHGNFTYMSALCWLFGRYLHDTLRYPVGLISSSWAGTPIEAWSSERSLKACGVPRQGFMPSDLETGPSEYSVLWNAMIHPLRNMTLKGVIWYQGEANVNFNRDLYNCTFPALIEDWRQTFHDGSQGQTERFFPFGFVQLSSYLSGATPNDGLPEIRWHQTADFGYVPNLRMPNTFMAVAMDLCDRNSPFGSTHPRDKQTVAYRLHLGARAVAYGAKLTFQGPLPQKIELLGDMGLLNLTYSQPIQVQRHNKIFEKETRITCRHSGRR